MHRMAQAILADNLCRPDLSDDASNDSPPRSSGGSDLCRRLSLGENADRQRLYPQPDRISRTFSNAAPTALAGGAASLFSAWRLSPGQAVPAPHPPQKTAWEFLPLRQRNIFYGKIRVDDV